MSINPAQTPLDSSRYQTLYARSIQEPEQFWAEQALQWITWQTPWRHVKTGSFNENNVRWFVDAKLNACVNCVDRHLHDKANKTAIIWEGDSAHERQTLTYQDLHTAICRLANVLKAQGLKAGDCVCIYLPMIPEAVIAMLACARLGIVHSVVFGGFSPESLRSRIDDAECKLVITANVAIRAGKKTPFKEQVDKALEKNYSVKKVLVIACTEDKVAFQVQRDLWYHEAIAHASDQCEPTEQNANDPLFILYTSGSTGKPKGILHSTGGYLVYAASTFRYVFDYQDTDIFWCTADVGWITGHTYNVYGPLCNGATIVLFAGVPNFPTPARCWEIIDRYQVSIFYTAPTAIRALRHEGDQWLDTTKRDSLRILGSVGEPINPDAWEWYFNAVGKKRCPVIDTWWQTETGGIMISPLAKVSSLKPGSATKPLFGIVPKIVDEQGNALPPGTMGSLIITTPWPGMMLTVYKDHERFIETYFKKYPGNYLTGDQALCDAEGYYWISGRSDDVIKVSGHRIGSAEVESAIIENEKVSESAVVGVPDEIKGQSIYAFITLKKGQLANDSLREEIIKTVRDSMGAIAIPKFIQWSEALPKTRSGKIMRRILRKIACGESEALGDLTTLADPSVVEALIKDRIKLPHL